MVARVATLDWLTDAAQHRRNSGLHRVLRARTTADRMIDLASNDYLGLVRHPDVVDAACAATRAFGTGATGSRLVTGTTTLHDQLEHALSTFMGAESALVFSSGYTANLAAVTALSGRGSLVLSDAHSHASLVDACRLSRARVEIYDRTDLARVEHVLRERSEERALVVTDSVFSADGELAPLHELHRLSRAHEALLVVDEAHGLGVRGTGGRGYVQEQGLDGAPDIVVTATLSKSLASQGGVVLGPAAVRDHLIDTARPFVFDTGLAPAAVGAASAALTVLRNEPERAAAVRERADRLADIAGVPHSQSAVVSVVLGDPDTAVRAADDAREQGVHVGCFRPPSVPVGTSRLRLTARATLTEDELNRVAQVLGSILDRAAA
ncbi:8-amino-7-oxononanoate synthase [Rhodococcus sp. BP-252]|uniref:8-amino-7-oxononanoate synthase n=1 Tax=Rhodococcoides kyotonense TaxID=398843 RepID=A0A177YC97_9NOCA|nr:MULTISPECIES: 8-amino-7-oxononanoate synthase [Rhodococcus]MBY6413622.1 8-amino-7-oxononanoate synthase [Rhodococcus sp. BP-320]MBY6418391.1 8-amino-7-oxononanoate synthase [Rhodococcus sp. BP-321]MBY6422516.1 8-amino-7-oxononanoate synthase [Rhodococcus sp. BP-324]MBY6428336.1 8-amino-7-oxononanoate synthase [Rhodococcus sp. BP-323]MBY6433513.1 8-amino-7-oxononanoate synthase [Rhodococcus sp. BP-322]